MPLGIRTDIAYLDGIPILTRIHELIMVYPELEYIPVLDHYAIASILPVKGKSSYPDDVVYRFSLTTYIKHITTIRFYNGAIYSRSLDRDCLS